MLAHAVHPGEVLKEELDGLGVSPTEPARQIEVPANRISQIIAGKRSITGDTALRLGHWFIMEPQFWMNLQAQFDLLLARDNTVLSVPGLSTETEMLERHSSVICKRDLFMDYLLALLLDPAAWVALAALVAMEVVLGIDNLIFIAILSNKLRLALLSTVAFIVQLTEPLFTVLGQPLSWRDLILIAGGLFLVWKATKEIHHRVDPDPEPDAVTPSVATAGVAAVIGQILVLDLVFSIDSIITAVGMTEHLPIMVVAVVAAVLTMLLAADPLSNFIEANPTIVMLALGFLLLIGTTLIADGFGVHVPKGYIYAAMAFSALVEGLNMMARRARVGRNKVTAKKQE